MAAAHGLHGLHLAAAHGLHGLHLAAAHGLHGLHLAAAHGLHGAHAAIWIEVTPALATATGKAIAVVARVATLRATSVFLSINASKKNAAGHPAILTTGPRMLDEPVGSFRDALRGK